MSFCIYIFFNVYTHIHVYMRIMHHICMYQYIHIYISILHTYTHRISALPHLAHVSSIFSQKKNVVASTVTSPAKTAWLHKFLMGASNRHKCEGCEKNVLNPNLGFVEFCWIFCASTIRGQKY